MASSSNNAGYPPNPNPNPCRYQLNVNFFGNESNIQIKGERDGLLGYNPFNVKSHDAIHRFFFQLPVNNVRCNVCSKHIGEKFIVVGDNDPPPPRPYPLAGKVFFYSDRLLFWNRKRFIDADSDELVMRLIVFDGTRLSISDTYLNEETNNGTDDETETDEETETTEDVETDEDAGTDEDVETDEDAETDEETEIEEDAETDEEDETDEEAETDDEAETDEEAGTDEEAETDDEAETGEETVTDDETITKEKAETDEETDDDKTEEDTDDED
ncbi:hypothetical protein V6N13_001017 [Hibiscus sabdariffa]